MTRKGQTDTLKDPAIQYGSNASHICTKILERGDTDGTVNRGPRNWGNLRNYAKKEIHIKFSF